MKRNIIHTLWMAAALPLCAVLASCEQEDFPGMAEISGTQTLSITVTDGGYAADGKSGSTSRAMENKFSTVFTAGDKCGLYIVRDGKLVSDNVCLTAKEGSDGSLIWEATRSLFCKKDAEYHYFLYYPYKEGNHEVDASAINDTDFFKSLICGWEVKPDQSSYADYTASDLMTAAAVQSETADGRVSLSFSMQHRMALAVVKIPGTVYKFTDSRIPDYTVMSADFGDSSAKPCLMPDYTYRYIVNPASGTDFKLSGSYAGGNKKVTIPLTIEAGCVKTFIVDNNTLTTINEFSLQVGDFILLDGNLVNKENITEEQKAKVAAVVFWTPAETETADRNTPASLTDDEIMTIEHPNCTHGLAVALTDVSTSYLAWQQNADVQVYYAFQNTDKFDVPNKSKYKPVMTGYGRNDNIQRVLGYQNTKILRAYNDYCSANNMPEYIVQPVSEIDRWAENHPAPQNSTGWYFPSTKELHILCNKDVDRIWLKASGGTETKDIVTSSFGILGASVAIQFKNDFYWTSFEWNETDMQNSSGRKIFYPYYVSFKNGQVNKTRLKYSKQPVRAVCAF